MLTDAEIRALKPQRHARKVSDSGGLYLLAMPKGGRCLRLKAALGKHTFIAMMREWKKAPDEMSNLCP
jgi:hypothetical protein